MVDRAAFTGGVTAHWQEHCVRKRSSESAVMEWIERLRRLCTLAACLGAACILGAEPSCHEDQPSLAARSAPAVLWREPEDIASRDLFHGPGGEGHQPRGTVFAFVKEDLAGSNPKFVVRDDTRTK